MNSMINNYQYWRLEYGDDALLWLYLDCDGSNTNTLSRAVLDELDEILQQLQQHPPAALMILSGKESGFIAGADIQAFTMLNDQEEALAIIRQGQTVMDHLEALSCPTVAAIHGFCMGGGLELALACDYRIVTDSDCTHLSLPEVKLGIHPGFGGTVRSTRLLGVSKAMPLMFSGRMVSSKAAVRMGLADFVVPLRSLKLAARQVAMKKVTLPKRATPWWQTVVNMKFSRAAIAAFLRYRLRKKVDEHHYPAPYALIRIWEDHGDNRSDMLRAEAESVAALITGRQAKGLIRCFFLREELKKHGKKQDFSGHHLHVIGAGVMGGDIAAWCALQGMQVTLQDQTVEKIAPAIARAEKLFQRKLHASHLRIAARDRLQADPDGFGISKADLVIEAIFENLQAKQELYHHIEPLMKKGAILASNTSSIPLDDLAAGLKKPERLVGLHFFNPVARMQLVEVIASRMTDEKVAATAAAFAHKIRKLPLPTKSTPGFLVNRVLMPYLMEAMMMVDEGKAPEMIDRAATAFGMPMGPILLADQVGLDICLSVAKTLQSHFGGDIPSRLERMVASGKLGKKSGEGFYHYKKGRVVLHRHNDDGDDITDRLILRLLNESLACLREGVVESADLLDAGMVFGTGFAPFHGGPVHYITTEGASSLLLRFKALEARYGQRFQADEEWHALVSKISEEEDA